MKETGYQTDTKRIPNDPLKWLKNSRFYGSINGMFGVSLSKLQPGKEAHMGRFLMVKN